MLRCGVRERKWVRARARHCKQKAGGGRPVAPRWWQVAAARGLGPALGPATAAASLRRATGTLVLPVVCVSHYDHTFHMYLGASSHYLPQSALGLLICPFGSAPRTNDRELDRGRQNAARERRGLGPRADKRGRIQKGRSKKA